MNIITTPLCSVTLNRATFCLDADFAGLSANVLAIPNLPITALSASPVTVSEAFFGMHVADRFNDGVSGITFKTVRSHDMRSGTGMWKSFEPNAPVGGVHTYSWANLDSWVDTHYAAGRDLVFTLFGTPTWASARNTEVGIYGSNYLGLCAEPTDMANWSAFCTAVATRYLGKIKYYEVWNEPNMNNNGTTTSGSSFFFSGTFAKLAEMVRLANQAIKAVDPTAKILCPAVQGWVASGTDTSGTYFTGMMSAATGDGSTTMKDWVDIIAVHLYPPTGNRVQDLAGAIDRVNTAKTTAGVSSKETWDTESAPIGGDVKYLSDEHAKAIIARMMLTMAAKGIARTIYYQYDHGTMGVIYRPAVCAFREQIVSLLQSGSILTVSRFTDGRVAYYTSAGVTII